MQQPINEIDRLRAIVAAQDDIIRWYEDECEYSCQDYDNIPPDLLELEKVLARVVGTPAKLPTKAYAVSDSSSSPPDLHKPEEVSARDVAGTAEIEQLRAFVAELSHAPASQVSEFVRAACVAVLDGGTDTLPPGDPTYPRSRPAVTRN